MAGRNYRNIFFMHIQVTYSSFLEKFAENPTFTDKFIIIALDYAYSKLKKTLTKSPRKKLIKVIKENRSKVLHDLELLKNDPNSSIEPLVDNPTVNKKSTKIVRFSDEQRQENRSKKRSNEDYENDKEAKKFKGPSYNSADNEANVTNVEEQPLTDLNDNITSISPEKMNIDKDSSLGSHETAARLRPFSAIHGVFLPNSGIETNNIKSTLPIEAEVTEIMDKQNGIKGCDSDSADVIIMLDDETDTESSFYLETNSDQNSGVESNDMKPTLPVETKVPETSFKKNRIKTALKRRSNTEKESKSQTIRKYLVQKVNDQNESIKEDEDIKENKEASVNICQKDENTSTSTEEICITDRDSGTESKNIKPEVKSTSNHNEPVDELANNTTADDQDHNGCKEGEAIVNCQKDEIIDLSSEEIDVERNTDTESDVPTTEPLEVQSINEITSILPEETQIISNSDVHYDVERDDAKSNMKSISSLNLQKDGIAEYLLKNSSTQIGPIEESSSDNQNIDMQISNDESFPEISDPLNANVDITIANRLQVFFEDNTEEIDVQVQEKEDSIVSISTDELKQLVRRNSLMATALPSHNMSYCMPQFNYPMVTNPMYMPFMNYGQSPFMPMMPWMNAGSMMNPAYPTSVMNPAYSSAIINPYIPMDTNPTPVDAVQEIAKLRDSVSNINSQIMSLQGYLGVQPDLSKTN